MFQRPSGNNPVVDFGPNFVCDKQVQNSLQGNKGISVVELLVGAGILAMSLGALLGFLSFAVSAASIAKQQMQATALAEGALESVRNFRDGIPWNADDPQNQYDGLGRVQTGVPLHAQMSGGAPRQWQIVSGPETLGIFTRTIVFENVQRDVNNNIVAAGGIQDPDTKKVTVTVSWSAKTRTHDLALTAYLTNWKQ